MLKEALLELYEEGAFAGAVASVVKGGKVIETASIGYRAVIPEREEMTEDTLFDMASVSKVLGPGMTALRLIHLDDLDTGIRLSSLFPDAGDFKEASILDLLRHSAGFLPELPLWKTASDRNDFLRCILHSELQYKPGTGAIYSCLGYIILADALERISGDTLPHLAENAIWEIAGMKNTSYGPVPRERAAATERITGLSDECWKGVVHDENARFLLPWTSGNAGIFSDIHDMSSFALMVLREMKEPYFFTPEEVRLFSSDLTAFAGISRTGCFMLNERGYDMNGGSVAGKNSFGHTGFTGTSIWFSPDLDAAAILLSNRIHPDRENLVLRKRLGAFHDRIFGFIRDNYD